MRILYVVPVTGFGGIEKMVLEWVSYMEKQGHCCDVLAFEEGNNQSFLKINGSLRYLKICVTQFFSSKKRLIHFFKENPNYDIVHANVSFLNGLVFRCAKKVNSNTKTVSHAHLNGYSRAFSSLPSKIFHYFLYFICKCYINSYSDIKIACSNKAGVFLYNRNPFVFLPNGIDISRYAFSLKKRNDGRKELGIDNQLVLLNVGRFTKVKNQIFMVSVFEEVLKLRPNSLLLFAGDGDEINSVKRYCSENNSLNKSVLFLGNRNDVDMLYCVADVFVLTSTIEGFPVAAVEAQVSGLTCFLSYASPCETNISGLVSFFETNNVELWAKSIASIDSNHDRIQYSKKIGATLYNINNSSAFLENLYFNK